MIILSVYNIMVITILVVIVTIVKASKEHHDNIFIKGKILHTVQTSSVFHDCKTFVDMKLKFDKEKVVDIYNKMLNDNNNNVSINEITKFVNECFDEPGSEFEEFDPVDWKKDPKLINDIENEAYKNLANHLNNLWRKLGRKIKDDVKNNPDHYSMIYVPNPVIIPGGRFREFYYWDSYWIILGLLHSEMFTTVKGMLENFIHMVNRYGFVPNGGRIYYTGRSQPPLLIPMVKIYYEATRDKEFVKNNIEVIEKEFEFWTKERLETLNAEGTEVKVAHYNVKSGGPRPESYREDIEVTNHLANDKDKDELYANIKSACESGWDFSSRWFIRNGENKGNLIDTKTRAIIPVDLNAILCGNAKILSNFFYILGLKDKTSHYNKIHKDWVAAVETLLWDDEEGVWFDYDTSSKKKRKYFYASNVAPLWTACYDKDDNKKIASKVVNYLIKKINVTSYVGGIPTSLEGTGEQWDFPNTWPPLVHIMIRGLDLTKQDEAKVLARDLANTWIASNSKGYEETKEMFEKYDCETPGVYGGGGEYTIQVGFGWTNGVLLDLLHLYGRKTKQITAPKSRSKNNSPSILLTTFFLYFVPLAILCN